MRVISGFLRGRKILLAKGDKTRPSKQIVREAVFDTVRGWVEGKRVMELFAGTGAMGIESISNGASGVVFLESEKQAADIISRNLQLLGISDKGVVKRGLVEKDITAFKGQLFDLIIADPPYGYQKNRTVNLLKSILDNDILNREGILIFEHRAGDAIPEVCGLQQYREKRYGKTVVSYLRRADSNEI